jgi:small subunit ribosomal protein S5
VIESAGIQDILTKSLGSNNPHNVVKATMQALLQLRPEKEVWSRRGLDGRESAGKPAAEAGEPAGPAR